MTKIEQIEANFLAKSIYCPECGVYEGQDD